jgi:hypothetical protein
VHRAETRERAGDSLRAIDRALRRLAHAAMPRAPGPRLRR